MTVDVRAVVLHDVSVPLFWAMERHHDEMQREFALIAIDRARGGAAAVPARLLQLVTDLRARYGRQRSVLLEAMQGAAERGDETVTVRVDMPAAAAEEVAAACATYEEADAFCRSGDLLTLSVPPEVGAFRRALCESIVAQLRP